MGETVVDAVLRYTSLGFSVLPLRPGTKAPAIRSWEQLQTERPSASQVKHWFGSGNKGVAIVLGTVSGNLVCRDFDDEQSYAQWAASHPDLAKSLPTVRTSRGYHVYFRVRDVAETQARLSVGAVQRLPDGELRLEKCYVVAPPSRHESGHVYEWLNPLPGAIDGIPILDPVEAGFVPVSEFKALPPTPEHPPTTPEKTCLPLSLVSPLSLLSREDVILAIARSLPTGPRQRNTHVFVLARELKAIPDLADAPLKVLKPIVKRWHEASLPVIRTKEFEETWSDFARGWRSARFPKGWTLQTFLDRALAGPLPEEAQQYESSPMRELMALCRELQRANPNEPFWLSCWDVGKLFGVAHTTGFTRLNNLCIDGVLAVVKRGTPGAAGKATRYKYLPDLNA